MDERREVFQSRRQHLRQEIDQIFADAAHWNLTHPNEEPIDPDPDDELARMAVELDADIARYIAAQAREAQG